jgi:hypothetical protein
MEVITAVRCRWYLATCRNTAGNSCPLFPPVRPPPESFRGTSFFVIPGLSGLALLVQGAARRSGVTTVNDWSIRMLAFSDSHSFVNLSAGYVPRLLQTAGFGNLMLSGDLDGLSCKLDSPQFSAIQQARSDSFLKYSHRDKIPL